MYLVCLPCPSTIKVNQSKNMRIHSMSNSNRIYTTRTSMNWWVMTGCDSNKNSSWKSYPNLKLNLGLWRYRFSWINAITNSQNRCGYPSKSCKTMLCGTISTVDSMISVSTSTLGYCRYPNWQRRKDQITKTRTSITYLLTRPSATSFSKPIWPYSRNTPMMNQTQNRASNMSN
jgi:hypothetical protein